MTRKMTGLGTLINAAGALLGGLVGVFIGKALKTRFQDILICACGVCVIFIGAAGTLQKMLVIEGGALNVTGTLMMIVSLGLGALLGELINLEALTERFGDWLKKKTGSTGDARFTEGFVSTSLTICIGAMAVMGSINDALYGDYSLLTAKALLDAIIVLAMASSMGRGCLFSVIPLVLIQGSITALAKLIEPLLTSAALDNLSLVGSVLIFCVGINLCFGKRIRVANLLPALVFAVGWAFLPK